MTTSNSKYVTDKRTTAMKRWFFPSLRLILSLSGVYSVSSHVATKSFIKNLYSNSIFKIFINLAVLIALTNTYGRIPNISFCHTWCSTGFSHSYRHWSLSWFCSELNFPPSKFTCTSIWNVVLIFFIHSFIHLIILNSFKFRSSVLLGTHIFPKGSSTVLQLPLDISRLNING